jgi:hypothetical protein
MMTFEKAWTSDISNVIVKGFNREFREFRKSKLFNGEVEVGY